MAPVRNADRPTRARHLASETFSATRDDRVPGAVVIAAHGELDIAGTPVLERALDEAIADRASIVLDLRDLSFCDVSGLRVVLAADDHAWQAGLSMVILRGTSAAHRIFELTGCDRTLQLLDEMPLHPDCDQRTERRLRPAWPTVGRRTWRVD